MSYLEANKITLEATNASESILDALQELKKAIDNDNLRLVEYWNKKIYQESRILNLLFVREKWKSQKKEGKKIKKSQY